MEKGISFLNWEKDIKKWIEKQDKAWKNDNEFADTYTILVTLNTQDYNCHRVNYSEKK